MPHDHEFILTLSCRDTTGIVYAVSGLLYQAGCNIIDSQQFGDLEGDDATGLFFMRVHFEAPPQLASPTRCARCSSTPGSSSAWRCSCTPWRSARACC